MTTRERGMRLCNLGINTMTYPPGPNFSSGMGFISRFLRCIHFAWQYLHRAEGFHFSLPHSGQVFLRDWGECGFAHRMADASFAWHRMHIVLSASFGFPHFGHSFLGCRRHFAHESKDKDRRGPPQELQICNFMA